MLAPRIIPTLLIEDGRLVKTVRFAEPKYVGDPINAVKIFNEKEADEILVLDISASRRGREPNYSLIEKLAGECRMPLCYGGGIKSVAQGMRIIELGVEKVSLSSSVIDNPDIVAELSKNIGTSSVVVTLDIAKKKGLLARSMEVVSHNGTKRTGMDPVQFALDCQELGAGELVFNFVDREGTGGGYDIGYVRLLKERLNVPITVVGGAKTLADMCDLVANCGLTGAAAGSLFVFKGKYRAVLINYPSHEQKAMIYESLLHHEEAGWL